MEQLLYNMVYSKPLNVLAHLILIIIVKMKKRDTEKIGNLPNVTQLSNSKDQNQTLEG